MLAGDLERRYDDLLEEHWELGLGNQAVTRGNSEFCESFHKKCLPQTAGQG